MGVGRELTMITTSQGQRYTDDELAKLSIAADGGGRGGGAPGLLHWPRAGVVAAVVGDRTDRLVRRPVKALSSSCATASISF